MIRGGVPNTHTTVCIPVLYSLQFLPISFPNRALPMEITAGIACPLFIFLAYSLLHWFYTLDFSRSYVLVPAALTCYAYQSDTLCSPWLLLTFMTNFVQQTELDSHYLREGEEISFLLYYCIKHHKVKKNSPTRYEYSEIAVQHAYSNNRSIEA